MLVRMVMVMAMSHILNDVQLSSLVSDIWLNSIFFFDILSIEGDDIACYKPGIAVNSFSEKHENMDDWDDDDSLKPNENQAIAS